MKIPGSGIPAAKDPAAEGKSPVVAGLSSMLIPGLGQAYNGRIGRGIEVMLGTALGFLVFLVPGAIVWIYGIVDAFLTADRMNRKEIPFRSSRTQDLVVFLLLTGIVIMAAIIFAAILELPRIFGTVGGSLLVR